MSRWAIIAVLASLAALIFVAIQKIGSGGRTPPGSVSQQAPPESPPAREEKHAGSPSEPAINRQEIPDTQEAEAEAESPSLPESADSDDDSAFNDRSAQSAFADWRVRARARGIEVPNNLELPPELRRPLLERYDAFFDEIRRIDEKRLSIIHEIHTSKLERGQYEEFPHPSTISDPDERKALRKRIREARKPTRPHQSVSDSGNSEYIRFVRIDETEDRRLPAMYLAIDRAKAEYIDGFHVLIAPYF